MKRLLTISIIVQLILTLFFLSGCSGKEEEEEAYTLTASEQKLADLAYNSRHIWEKHNGKSCGSIRYVRKNGYDFLLATYWSTPAGFEKSDMQAGLEVKYTLNTDENRVYEALANEYGSIDVGAVVGIVGYDTSGSEADKKQAIGKAISGKSYVYVPKVDG